MFNAPDMSLLYVFDDDFRHENLKKELTKTYKLGIMQEKLV